MSYTNSGPRLVGRLIAGFLVLWFGAFLTAAGARAEDPAYYEWFKPLPEIAAAWEFFEVAGDPNQLLVRPKNPDTSAPQRRVFVMFPRPSSAYDVAMSKILDVFDEKKINAEFRIFNFEKRKGRGRLGLGLAKDGGYQLIFSMGSESTAWLWKHYRGGAVPVVSVCSKDPVVLGQAKSYDSGTGTNFAFTSLNMPIEAQMAYLLELKRNLKNLGILVNSKNVSAVQTQAKPIMEFAKRRGIRSFNLAIQEPSEAKRELSLMVRKAVATMRKSDPTLDNSVLWITGSTAVFREIRTINENSDRVPVLSVVPNVVKAGDDSAVMSIGIGFESNGHLAAIYGIDVLQGRANAGDLKVGIVTPPDIAINFRKAREIGLNIPFKFLESATYIYDYEGRTVRSAGKSTLNKVR